ncbi:MAG: RNA polymerase sigma factor [Deltaproteobacteria bacterium]|nr:RNA polymerase sigma factor [Deltaproteobacteria bacterium]
MASPAPLQRRGRGTDSGGDRVHPRRAGTSVLDRAPTDVELVRRACEGDRWAEEAIYRRYVQYVGAVVAQALRSPQDARDVVQETFVTALEQMGSLRDAEALRVWLVRIALSHVHRRYRWRRLKSWLSMDASGEACEVQPVDPRATPDVHAELSLLRDALDCVPCDARIAWVLHKVHGETTEDVASAIGCSLATAKRRVAEAEQAVHRHLASREAP